MNFNKKYIIFNLILFSYFIGVSSAYGSIPLPPPPPIPTNCDKFNELTCPVGANCEFDNEANMTKEPGHCNGGFDLCFCVSDIVPPPPPPPPEKTIDCSTLGTPVACLGICDFENDQGEHYSGHCNWLGAEEASACLCIPDSAPPSPPPQKNCNDSNQLICPVGASCEFDNVANMIKEPGHCDSAFGLCFCVPDTPVPPTVSAPEAPTTPAPQPPIAPAPQLPTTPAPQPPTVPAPIR